MRLIIQGLLGAVIGFFGMYAALNFDFTGGFTAAGFEMNLAVNIISILLLLFTAVSMVLMKKKANLKLNGDQEDERDVWQYKRFSDITLCTTAALVLSIVATGISIITEQPAWLLIASGVALMLSAILSISVSSMIKIIYPDRELPAPSAKHYAKKLLAASDEGEKFIMLQGLYKTFNTMNMALIFSLLLLIIYSVATGDSQLFAILVIGLVLIGTNAQYLLTIRNK